MKKFENPTISIQKFEPEEVMTSSCAVEALACTACYCELVQCPNGYTCVGLECATLSDFD